MVNIDLQTVQQLHVAMRPGESNRDCVLFAEPLAPSAPILDDLILLRMTVLINFSDLFGLERVDPAWSAVGAPVYVY